jgi:hypothetical protein
LPGDGYTAPAAVQKEFFTHSSWRRTLEGDGHARPKNESKLSEIIKEINDLREVRPQPQSTRTGLPAFHFLAACH